MSYDRVIPIFAAAFAIIYVVAEQWNFALVTYHPRIGEIDLLTRPSRTGPAMYWYGWMATALVGAAAVSLLALPLTKRWEPPAIIGWAIPLAIMVLFIYLMRTFFLR